jgi:hydroxymethylpyrimidine/phosphomethylpyrimidine kinase
VTAQNTLGVTAWEPVAPALVRGQIEAIVRDMGADAVKIGMLANSEIVEVVADALEAFGMKNVVLDPVMIAKGGDRLLEPSAIDAIASRLLPLADVVTPNVPEAEVLAGMSIESRSDMEEAGRRILARGPRVVLVKGGHMEGPASVDLAVTADGTFELRGERFETTSTHGTGCTLASAIAANLALGRPLREALSLAREYVEGAIRNAPGIGAGHGPLNHFWRLY